MGEGSPVIAQWERFLSIVFLSIWEENNCGPGWKIIHPIFHPSQFSFASQIVENTVFHPIFHPKFSILLIILPTKHTVRDDESTELKTMLDNEHKKLNESIDLIAYKVKKINIREDGTEIATEIKHFSHEHDLKLVDEVQNNEKCDGCTWAIPPLFYSCVKCSFFFHKSCVELHRRKRHALHRHPLTLLKKAPYRSKFFWCDACHQSCNGFTYNYEICKFDLDIQCSLISNTLIHYGHEHCLNLSSTTYEQKCSICDLERYKVFCCTTCEFTLDFKCATLPHITRYKQHEHSFTLCCIVEDNSSEYYCNICEEERDSKHWFYYYANCNYPTYFECILGRCLNCKFENASKFDRHEHPLLWLRQLKSTLHVTNAVVLA